MRGITFFQPPWKICSSDSCHNGCCQSTPCENGGACSVVCDIRAKRFKWACPPGYTGHKCQEAQRSCHDILLSGSHANGIYLIRNEANERRVADVHHIMQALLMSSSTQEGISVWIAMLGRLSSNTEHRMYWAIFLLDKDYVTFMGHLTGE